MFIFRLQNQDSKAMFYSSPASTFLCRHSSKLSLLRRDAAFSFRLSMIFSKLPVSLKTSSLTQNFLTTGRIKQSSEWEHFADRWTRSNYLAVIHLKPFRSTWIAIMNCATPVCGLPSETRADKHSSSDWEKSFLLKRTSCSIPVIQKTGRFRGSLK